MQFFSNNKNVQYNKLVYWADGTNDLSTKLLMFQVFFVWIIFYRLRALKALYFHFCNFIKKMKGFLQRVLQDFMKIEILGTSDTWSTSHLCHPYYIVD